MLCSHTVLSHNLFFPFYRMSSKITQYILLLDNFLCVNTVSGSHPNSNLPLHSSQGARQPVHFRLFLFSHNPVSPLRAACGRWTDQIGFTLCKWLTSCGDFVGAPEDGPPPTLTSYSLWASSSSTFPESWGTRWHVCLIRDGHFIVTSVGVGRLWACSNCWPLREKLLWSRLKAALIKTMS